MARKNSAENQNRLLMLSLLLLGTVVVLLYTAGGKSLGLITQSSYQNQTPADARGPRPTGTSTKCGSGKYKNVPCPVLTYVPNPVPANTIITFTGTKFTPNATIAWGLLGGITVFTAQTDSTGTATFDSPFPVCGGGGYVFWASDYTTGAGTQVSINCQ